MEHDPYPQKLISKIKKLMKKKSYLYIEVPIEKIVFDAYPKKPNGKLKNIGTNISIFLR
jgi:hypothetical protein